MAPKVSFSEIFTNIFGNAFYSLVLNDAGQKILWGVLGPKGMLSNTNFSHGVYIPHPPYRSAPGLNESIIIISLAPRLS